jgi:hypothetical protein
MAKIYGITDTQIIPQADFDASQNENGGWTARQSFQIKKESVDNSAIQAAFPLGVTLLSLDPNAAEFFGFLRLARVNSLATVEGGYTKIGCEFVGYTGGSSGDPGEPAPAPTYSKRGVLSEASLDGHPKWKALAALEQNALGKLISGEWSYGPDPFATGGAFYTYIPGELNTAVEPDPITSSDALEFANRIAQGRTTYKLGTYEYTHRWESNKGISSATMNDLGKISTPSGSPPTPGAGRDWMLVGANEEQYGSGDFRFTNELVYLLSDEDGHDSFLQS